jgi:hypothetical protein
MRRRRETIAVLLALVSVLVAVALLLPSWFWHPLGYCAGTKIQVRDCLGYNYHSGVGANLGYISIVLGMVATYWHHTCANPWCLHFGRYVTADGHHKLCRVCSPELPDHRLSLEEIQERHHAAKRERSP